MLKSISLAIGIALSLPSGLHAQQSQAPKQDQSASETDIEGGTMFATLCGFCHETAAAPPAKGRSSRATTRSDEFIVERIKKGKPGAMPAFGGAFSESQIMAILAYIRSIE